MYSDALALARVGDFDAIDPSILLRCRSALHAEYTSFQWKKSRECASVPAIVLYRWQAEIVDLLSREPDRRTIYSVVDMAGGCGKSTFADYMARSYPPGSTPAPRGVCVFTPGRGVDLAHLLEPARMFILDIPRCSGEAIPWAFVENLKNGYVVSTKYAGGLKRMSPPHVVIMSNDPIPDGTFSADRIILLDIKK